MLIVISPAKSLDYTSRLPTKKHSKPRMLDEAACLVRAMRCKSSAELVSMMGISHSLATLNHQRFAEWSTASTPQTARPALLAFSGDVYRSLDAPATFKERDYTHAQKVLRILSGLYGVLRPLDLMQPYRLEMGSKLATERGSTLYEFWGDRITAAVNDDLEHSPGTKAVVNLASKEYFRAVDARNLNGRLVNPIFLDGKGKAAAGKSEVRSASADSAGADVGRPLKVGSVVPEGGSAVREPRVLGFYAKRARGAMAAWIIRNRVKTIRRLRDFDGLGYAFSAEAFHHLRSCVRTLVIRLVVFCCQRGQAKLA